MLPEIHNTSLVSLEEVPYRLPSRFKTKTRKNFLTKSFIERFFERNNLDFRRSDRDFQDDTNEINAYFNSLDMEMARLSYFRESNDSSVENFQRATKDQLKPKNSLNQKTWNYRDHDPMNELKPMWINNLKKWILDNPSSAEFLQLSKTATLFQNKIWNNNLHFKIKDRSKHMDRLLRELQLENLEKEVSKEPDLKKCFANKETINKFKKIIKSTVAKDYPVTKDDSRSVVKSENLVEKKLKKEIPIKPTIKDSKDNFSGLEQNESKRTIVINLQEVMIEEEFTKISVEDDDSEIESEVNEPILSEIEDKLEEDIDVNEPVDEVIQEQPEETPPSPVEESNAEILESQHQNFPNFEIPEPNIESRRSPIIHKKKERDRRVMFNEKTIKKTEVNEAQNPTEETTTKDTILENPSEKIAPKPKPVMELPPLPPLPPIPEKQSAIEINSINEVELGREKFAPLLKPAIHRWGKMKQDLSYLVDLQKQEAAELRKAKAAELSKRMKAKKPKEPTFIIPVAPQLETYEFLSKYCILKDINISSLKETFNECDEDNKKWLNSDELILALKGVNPNLKEFDLSYLNMVMKTCDYNLRSGADFQLFSVLAALSIKITALDDWIKLSVGKSDFKVLEKKTYFCRKLWEVNVDTATKTMSLNSLYVEMKAGGVTKSHIREIKDHFKSLRYLTILDFFTYIPLFILTHSLIVENPLDTSEKL